MSTQGHVNVSSWALQAGRTLPTSLSHTIPPVLARTLGSLQPHPGP